MNIMVRSISALGLISALAAGAASAQPYAPNQAGVTMGHWHLNSRDIEANKKIFMAMGGVDGGGGPLQRVIFPGVMVILNLGANAAPATAVTLTPISTPTESSPGSRCASIRSRQVYSMSPTSRGVA